MMITIRRLGLVLLVSVRSVARGQLKRECRESQALQKTTIVVDTGLHVAAYARMLYTAIMSEFLVSDAAKFTYFIRMNKATFDIPLALNRMERYLNKRDTKLRLVIPMQEKL